MMSIKSTTPPTYTTMTELNTSEYLNDSYEYDYGELIKLDSCPLDKYDRITGICFIVICCFSFLGNSMLLYTLARFEDLKRVTMFFLLCLAVFDMVFTMTLPFWAVDNLMEWIFGDPACKVLTGAYFVGIYGSLILLTAMTVDCFLFIVVRSKWFTRRRRLFCAKLAVACAWIISVSACLQDALYSEVKNITNTRSCKAVSSDDNQAAYYTQFTMLFAVPLVIIVLCYGKILHTLMSSSGQRRYKTLLVVLLIIMAFVVCWGPYHFVIILMPQYDQEDCTKKIQLNLTFVICRILAYSHCCINPLLFQIRARSRKILSRLLFCPNRETHRNSEPSDRSSDPSHFNILRRSSVAVPQTVTELKSL